MTSTATPGSMRQRGGGGGPGFGPARGLRRHLRRCVRRHLRRRRVAAGAHSVPRRRPALRTGARPRSRRCSATTARDRIRRAGGVRDLPRQRRGQGLAARAPATPAAAAARCACRRASSCCSRPARAAAAAARSSSNPCDKCLGQGRVRKQKKLSVKIPPASTTATACGWRARARPDAMAGRRATCTSRSASATHAIFERDGAHLSCEVPVSFVTCGARRQRRSADARRRRCR